MLFDLSEFRKRLPAHVLAFASGANRPAEIRGFAVLKMPIGVAASELNEEAISLLCSQDHPVMVDSGAFAEMSFQNGVPTVVAPITDREWKRRLEIYRRLAQALGDKVMLVAPDQVGNQQETLARLSRYRAELADLAATRAVLLLPLQVGDMSHVEFYQTAQQAAGVPLVPAMPMRKAATSAVDLLEFVRAVRPVHLHLLGMGLMNRRAAKIVRLIEQFAPGTRISLDSNRLRAVTGKGRALTDRETKLRNEEIEGVYGAVQSTVLEASGTAMDYTDSIAIPSQWADPRTLKTIAVEALLSFDQAAAFLYDPDQFLQTPWPACDEISWIESPYMEAALDRAWNLYVARTVRSSVRTAAIVHVFSEAA